MVRREFLFALILLSVIGGVSAVMRFSLLESVTGAFFILGLAWFVTHARGTEYIYVFTSMLLVALRLILGISSWAWLGSAVLVYILLILPVKQRERKKLSEKRVARAVVTASLPSHVPLTRKEGAARKTRKRQAGKRRRTRATRVKKDDLTLIRGIGPKVARALGQAGIKTFKDLATAPIGKIEAAARNAGLRAIPAADWQKQAQLAAEGKWNELRSVQRRNRQKKRR